MKNFNNPKSHLNFHIFLLAACLSIGFSMQKVSIVYAELPAHTANMPQQDTDAGTAAGPAQNPAPDNGTEQIPAQDPDVENPVQDPDDKTEQNPTQKIEYTDHQGIIYTLNEKDQVCYVSSWDKQIEKSVTIPTEITQNSTHYPVTGISSSAFEKCTALRKMIIPNSITDLGDNIFSGCKNLSSIEIIPVKYTTKISDKVSVIRAAINNALLSTSAKVAVKIDNAVIEKIISAKKSKEIVFNLSIIQHKDYENTGKIPDSILLQPQTAKIIAAHNKNFRIKVKNSTGSSYNALADASELEKTSKEINFSLIETSIKNLAGTRKTDLRKALKKNDLTEDNTCVFQYYADKNSQINIKFAYPVTSANEIYIYHYSKTKQTFVSLSYHPYVVSKNGTIKFTAVKGGLYVIAPKKFSYMYSMPHNQFLTEGGNTYYVNNQGTLLYGWNRIGNAYYYFDRETGKMAADKTVDGIPVKKDGTAEKKTPYIAKIQTMIKARAIVEQVTNSSDSKSEKIRKCFLWIFQFPYKQYRRLKPIYSQDGWEVTFANDIFDYHQGCCVSEASALAFLFHECGYPTVYVCHDTGHAWVELNGRVYDPLFAEARGVDNYYNVSYPQYRLYPVGKRLI